LTIYPLTQEVIAVEVHTFALFGQIKQTLEEGP